MVKYFRHFHKDLIYFFYFFPIHRHPSALLKLWHFFFLLFSGPPCKAGWERFFWCLYSCVMCFSRLSYCSLSHSPSWCADIQMSHQYLFYLFIFVVVRLIFICKIHSKCLLWIYLSTFNLPGILNKIRLDVFIKWLIFQACNSAESVQWLGNFVACKLQLLEHTESSNTYSFVEAKQVSS